MLESNIKNVELLKRLKKSKREARKLRDPTFGRVPQNRKTRWENCVNMQKRAQQAIVRNDTKVEVQHYTRRRDFWGAHRPPQKIEKDAGRLRGGRIATNSTNSESEKRGPKNANTQLLGRPTKKPEKLSGGRAEKKTIDMHAQKTRRDRDLEQETRGGGGFYLKEACWPEPFNVDSVSVGREEVYK
jgi:hypothetical protein